MKDKFSPVPLSSYGKPYTLVPYTVYNKFDMKTAVRDQVDAPERERLLQLSCAKTNPPAAADAPIVEKVKAIGLEPGKDFDPSKLGAFDKEVIKGVPKLAQVKIMEYFKKAAEPVNGWMDLTKDIGLYGTNYIQRALVTAIGLGANRPQDAIYPTTQKDGNGREYDGASKKYVIRFNKGEVPPVNGFWSITMYDKDYFFVRIR